MNFDELVKKAQEAKKRAYAPYSGFRVGAAVIGASGKVYTGVNIENASFGATNCAERTAIFKAVSEGERNIKAVAIASDSTDTIYPCGICRQVIAEFADSETMILCSKNNGEYSTYRMEELLPKSFGKEDLKPL